MPALSRDWSRRCRLCPGILTAAGSRAPASRIGVGATSGCSIQAAQVLSRPECAWKLGLRIMPLLQWVCTIRGATLQHWYGAAGADGMAQRRSLIIGKVGLFSMDEGSCDYYGYKFRHVCIWCGGEHHLSVCNISNVSGRRMKEKSV